MNGQLKKKGTACHFNRIENPHFGKKKKRDISPQAKEVEKKIKQARTAIGEKKGCQF